MKHIVCIHAFGISMQQAIREKMRIGSDNLFDGNHHRTFDATPAKRKRQHSARMVFASSIARRNRCGVGGGGGGSPPPTLLRRRNEKLMAGISLLL